MNGLILAKYDYSPYGKFVYSYEDDSIKGLNHFKYKSYYYDDESNMYYLITRYYLPEIGRFISPNIVADKISYTYCSNNPIDYLDSTGEF